MILKGNEDVRICRTITAIKGSFVELMGELPYEKITVKGLVERAGINKKTFYYHYASLEDLLCEMQEELLDAYMEQLPVQSRGVLRTCIDVFFRFFAEKGDSYVRIVTRDTSGRVYQKLLELDQKLGKSAKQRWDALSEYAQKDFIICFNAIIMNTLARWVDEGRPVPIEELIDRTARLSLTGIYGMLGVDPRQYGY